MNSSPENYTLLSANSNPALSKEISDIMGQPLADVDVSRFSDGEISVNIGESVRGKDCFLIQSSCPPVNDNLMELLIMIDALKRASAGRINAVIPYFGYARQDRKAKARDPITAKLVSNLIEKSGADKVVSMDLHANQIQGYFDIPVDYLLGSPVLTKYFKEKGLEDPVIVSPDHGSVVRARNMAEPLHAPIAIVDKRRPEPNKSEIMNIIGDIKGKNCILVDDMVDTAGTITNAANALEELGAKNVYACATHPLFSGPAIERVEKSAIKEMVVLNTIPLDENKKIDKITMLSVAQIFADAMDRIHRNASVSEMFK